MKKKNHIGRPKKDAKILKSHSVKIRVTENELKKLKRRGRPGTIAGEIVSEVLAKKDRKNKTMY